MRRHLLLLTLLVPFFLGPPPAAAAEPATDAVPATAPAQAPHLDLGGFLTTDVYDLQRPSYAAATTTVTQDGMQGNAAAPRTWPRRSSLRRDQALVGVAVLVAGLLVAPSRNEWPIDEGWIGLGGSAVGVVLLLDSAFGPHWGPP